MWNVWRISAADPRPAQPILEKAALSPTLHNRMTPEELSQQRRQRICIVLPWCLAAAGLVIYLATLNHWIGFGSLAVVSQVSGWDWLPSVSQPLLFLVTLPLKLLPASLVPITLNVLTALLAGATLWLLARSIAILPRDRLASFRSLVSAGNSWELPLAWLPPMLACAVFGLQLSVWEHATVATGEVFDLFLLAYVVRSLLEFRHSGREKWLDRAVLLAALAATNNFAALGYLPLVLASVWWLKGYDFFESRFLVRVLVLLLAGLSLYFLHPIIVAFTPDSPLDFWKAFRQNLGGQVKLLIALGSAFWYGNRDVAVLLALVSLLPVLFMSIRWRSFSGGSLHVGAALVTLPFHIAHGALLVICLWAFLDPPFGPRVAGQRIGYMAYLSLYYLAAVSVGYYAGYFLQLFGDYPPDDWAIGADTRRKVALGVRVLGIFLLIAMPALLVIKNFAPIRHGNSDLALRQAQELASGLPPEGSVFLSDDPLRLALVQAALAREGKLAQHTGVDTRILRVPKYLQFLHRRHPERFPPPGELPNDREVDPMTVIHFLVGTAQTNSLLYLHPSFGYFFEALYLEPHGPLFTMRPYATNSLALPVPAPAVLASNQQYWAKLKTEWFPSLTNRIAASMDPARTPLASVLKKLRIRTEPDNLAFLIGAWQSRQLTSFAVDLQRAGQLESAGNWFREAMALKPDNLSAAASLQVNSNLLAHQSVTADRSRPPEAAFGRYRGWETVLNENGPFDNPDFNYGLGLFFAVANPPLYRQAAGQFNRAAELDPSFTPAMLMLASVYGLGNRFEETLSLISQARTNRGFNLLTPNEKLELSLSEASARLARGEIQPAEQIISGILALRTNEPAVMERVFSLYASGGQLTNALAIALRQQAISPTNAIAFINEGYLWMQMGLYSNAVSPLSRALALASNNVPARFNRAFALLRMSRLEESRQDYQFLDNLDPEAPQVQFGLGEVAFQMRETNTAMQHYSRYLSNAPPNAAEIKYVQDRLKELAPPKK
jgi:tetratricopeptide (TPR) repeat protein